MVESKNILRIWAALGVLALAPGIAAAPRERGPRVESHRIVIELLPAVHGLRASDEMTLSGKTNELYFYLNKSFSVQSVHVNGREVGFRFDTAPDLSSKTLRADHTAAEFRRAGRLRVMAGPRRARTVRVTYTGELREEPAVSQFSREYIADQTAGIISETGSFLAPDSFWYPRGDEEMSRFSVETLGPAGYESVSDGGRRLHEIRDGKLAVRWENPHPADGLYLQAAPYVVSEGESGGIKVYTYFFPGGDELAALYMEKSKQYLAFYSDLLGPYPYEKFAVVENFFETGYGMPSWTLLGRTVVRLPFIPDTSLPHEICHNWWGNGVFVDYALGNWCEGLTALCADYLLQKRRAPGGDADYRRQVLRDYASYVRGNNDIPLAAFRERDNPASRAVGYGKSLMVFHDLERRVGEKAFFSGLRLLAGQWKFRRASWLDVLAVFEKLGGPQPAAFYRQWVARSGAPLLRLEGARLEEEAGRTALNFALRQEGAPYELSVPLTIVTPGGTLERTVPLATARGEFRIVLDQRPLRLEIDPQNHLFRRLFPEEIPPSIAKVLGAERPLIVWQADSAAAERFRSAAEQLDKNRTALVRSAVPGDSAERRDRAFVLVGGGIFPGEWTSLLQPVWKRIPLAPGPAEDPALCTVTTLVHPDNPDLAVLVLNAGARANLEAVVRKLPHYGKYSYLAFIGETNIAKGIWDVTASPLIVSFATMKYEEGTDIRKKE
ncbi:MAG: M1 family peptidase [Chrysiogenales bacterium]|nr:MAG: M1 family peptidase [Chrysiogenales bacterium]